MRALVIGAGIAGLVAARDLARAGHDVTVVEASESFGGMVSGRMLGGITVDAGAEAYATRTPEVADLCRELGLTPREPQGRAFVHWPQPASRWPLAEGILGIPASLDDAAVSGALTAREQERAALDLTTPLAGPWQTVAELVADRLGEPVVERLVAPLTSGVYGMPPSAMKLAQFAPGLLPAVQREGSLVRAVAALHSGRAAVEQPDGGMFRVIDRLVEDLRHRGADLRTGVRATRLARNDQWCVATTDGPLGAGRVVVATPACIAAELLEPLGLQIDVPPTTITRSVLLAVRHRGLDRHPVGSGVLLGRQTDELTARSLTHYSAKWPWAQRDGVHILRVAWPHDDDPGIATVLADVCTLTGVALEESHVVDWQVVTWPQMPRSVAPAVRGQITDALADLPGLALAGAWLAGNGLGAVVAHARGSVA